MTRLNKSIELTANILIIVVAVFLISLLAKKYLFDSDTANQLAPVEPIIGSVVKLTDVNWIDQEKTLLLVLQKGCHFCAESAPFYKRIVQNTANRNIRLFAIFPGNPEEGRAYLDGLGITNLEVRQSPLDELRVSGTPTLILINNKGEVMDYWIGKLPTDKEDEVINQLNS